MVVLGRCVVSYERGAPAIYQAGQKVKDMPLEPAGFCHPPWTLQQACA